jgi:hypothetical protein
VVTKLPIFYDENGKRWDNLRNMEGAIKVFQDFLDRQGCSIDTYRKWFSAQRGNSWNPGALSAKYFHYKNIDIPRGKVYWRSGHGTYDRAKEAYDMFSRHSDFDREMTAYHAFNYEFLGKTDMIFNNRSTRTLKLFRTESESVVERYGIQHKKQFKGDSFIHPIYDSASVVNLTEVEGSELMLYDSVPHHRVVGNYIVNLEGAGGCPLYSDDENEFLVMLHGLSGLYDNRQIVGHRGIKHILEDLKKLLEE